MREIKEARLWKALSAMIDSDGHAVSLLLRDQAFVKENLIVIVKPELFGQKALFLLLSVSGFVSQKNPSPHIDRFAIIRKITQRERWFLPACGRNDSCQMCRGIAHLVLFRWMDFYSC